MRISDWSSDVCSSDLRLEQRPHVAITHILRPTGIAGQSGRKNNGKIQLFFRGPEFVEQIERGVDDMIRARARTVDLVDHHDGLEAKRSEARRVGEEGVSKCRSRWSHEH